MHCRQGVTPPLAGRALCEKRGNRLVPSRDRRGLKARGAVALAITAFAANPLAANPLAAATLTAATLTTAALSAALTTALATPALAAAELVLRISHPHAPLAWDAAHSADTMARRAPKL